MGRKFEERVKSPGHGWVKTVEPTHDKYGRPCGPTALVNALIELEAQNVTLTEKDLQETVDCVFASIREEMKSDKLMMRLHKEKGFTINQLGTLPIGILRTVNREVVDRKWRDDATCRRGRRFCKGFKAQIYMTHDAIKRYPVMNSVLKDWNVEVVENIPEIKPYERCLEQVVEDPQKKERLRESACLEAHKRFFIDAKVRESNFQSIRGIQKNERLNSIFSNDSQDTKDRIKGMTAIVEDGIKYLTTCIAKLVHTDLTRAERDAMTAWAVALVIRIPRNEWK